MNDENIFDGFYGIDPETEELGLGFFKKLRKKAKKFVKKRVRIAKKIVKSTKKFAKSKIGKVAISAALGVGGAALVSTGIGGPLATTAFKMVSKVPSPVPSSKQSKLFSLARKSANLLKAQKIRGVKIPKKLINNARKIVRRASVEQRNLNRLNLRTANTAADSIISSMITPSLQKKMAGVVGQMQAAEIPTDQILKSYLTSKTFKKQSLPATLEVVKRALTQELLSNGADPATIRATVEADAPIIAAKAVNTVQSTVKKPDVTIDPKTLKTIGTGVATAIIIKAITD